MSDHKDCKITKENGGVGFGVHYKNSTAVTIKWLIKLCKMAWLLYKEWQKYAFEVFTHGDP